MRQEASHIARQRRYPYYAVVDAHTGEVYSQHNRRKLAEAAVIDHSQRVRGTHVIEEIDA